MRYRAGRHLSPAQPRTRDGPLVWSCAVALAVTVVVARRGPTPQLSSSRAFPGGFGAAQLLTALRDQPAGGVKP